MDTQLKKSALSRYLFVWAFLLTAVLALLVTSHFIVRANSDYVLDNPGELSQVLPEQSRTAVVFGSAVNDITDEPRPIVKARLDMVRELYDNGHISSIIVSGHEDTVAMDYNEPGIMADYLTELGVAENDIVLDNRGDNSFLTCYQARHTYNLDSAVLVTQQSHIHRTLYLCRNMGMDAYGITADAVSSDKGEVLQFGRETFSNVKAVLDMTLRYNGVDE